MHEHVFRTIVRSYVSVSPDTIEPSHLPARRGAKRGASVKNALQWAPATLQSLGRGDASPTARARADASTNHPHRIRARAVDPSSCTSALDVHHDLGS